MSSKKYLRFLDVVFWATLAVYVLGVVYTRDIFRVCAGLAFISLLLGVDLRELSISKAFADLAQSIQKKKMPKSLGGQVAGFVSIYLVVLFLLAPLIRHWAFATYRWDLALFEHMIWRGAHGLGITTTIIDDSIIPRSYLNDAHLTLWLIPASWLYKVLPFTETLLLLQSLFLIGCLIPLWKIARRVLPDGVSPIILPLFFWLAETVHRVNIWDIHENGFIMLPTLWAFAFFLEKKRALAFLCALAMAFLKEDAWVIAGAMWGYFLIRERRYALAALSMIAGMGVFIYYGLTHTLNSIPFVARFSYLGSNLEEAKQIVSHKPWVFILHLLTYENILYFSRVMIMGGFLWICGGLALITMAPTYFEIALASHVPMKLLSNHYMIAVVGPLLFCAALGIKNLHSKMKNKKLFIKVVTGAFLFSMIQLETAEPAFIWKTLQSKGWKEKACYKNLISKIPDDVILHADDPFSSHVNKRPVLLKTPEGFEMKPGSWAIIPSSQLPPKGGSVVAEQCGYVVLANR